MMENLSLNQIEAMLKELQTLKKENEALRKQVPRKHPVIEIGQGVPSDSDDHGELVAFNLAQDGKFTIEGRLNKTGWLAGREKKFVLNFSTAKGFKKFVELPNDNLLVCSLAIGYSKDGKRK
jgi:hypothetical protein